MKKIVIDVYGADRGEMPVLCGSAKALLEDDSLFAVFVGDKDTIENAAKDLSIPADRYSIIHTDEKIENCDIPMDILKGKAKESCSMGLALDALRDDPDTIGLLSCGSTGALMIGSIFRLGLIKGLKMPALSSALPAYDGEKLVCLLDCGANIDCKAKDLYNFALMGEAYIKSMFDTERPTVGLMSVGREDSKGNSLTKEAFALLKDSHLNFIGNMEGNDLLSGYADVIVADGFSGNLLLKNAEACGRYAQALVEDLCDKHNAAPELRNAISELLDYRFNFNANGGATFLGTKKTVIKMHGSANNNTAYACIKQLLRLHDRDFDHRIAECLEK